jgi:oligoribonuclease NrnB/cAMP/cGMP phosphodiesterase (DHH superfamily)
MKIAVIYHSIDLDGWMSAAIVKYWFSNQEVPNKKGEPISTLDFIGYNYGQPIPDLSEYDKVIMCDISFPKEEMEKLFDKLESNFIWIDHHKSAINMMFIEGERSIHPLGLQQTDYAACELTWMYFFPNEPMPEIVRLLGRYDCFGHKNTEEEQKVLEFQYGARERITDYKSAYDVLCITKDEKLHMGGQYFDNYINQIYDAGKAIYRYLCTDAKQSYKNGFDVTLFEKVNDGVQDYAALMRKFICINKERFNPINFNIDYHKEGYDGAMCFHIDNNKTVCISLYNDNGEVDCSTIAKSFGGGGHKGAAGCRMNINDFKNLIQ